MNKENTSSKNSAIKEDTFSFLINKIQAAVVVHDVNTKIIYCNPKAEELLGLSEDQLLGKQAIDPAWKFIHADRQALLIEEYPVNQVLAKKDTIEDITFGIYHPDKENVVWVLVKADPMFDEKGEIYQVIVTFVDITKQTRSALELNESEMQFKNLFETMAQGVVYQDSSGHIISANPAAENILGLSLDQMRKKTSMDPEWHAIHEDGSNYPGETHPAMIALKEGRIIKNKLMGVYNSKIRSYNWININAIPKFRSGETKPYQVYTTFEDITKRINAELEMIKAKELAENSEKLKSEFLAQMSHEIRTPINAILSFSTLLKDDYGNLSGEEINNSFEIMGNAGKRIMRTIDLILNMSEVQTGTYELEQKKCNLFQDILIPLSTQHEQICKTKGIDIIIDKNKNDIVLNIDEYTVTQIFDNLLGNAIKYTEKGKIKISGYHNEKEIVIEISDTGVGISEEYLPKLFQPFSQEEQGYTRKYEGAGLGLALVKEYCELNNAVITCTSKKGVGSKFSIIFTNTTE